MQVNSANLNHVWGNITLVLCLGLIKIFLSYLISEPGYHQTLHTCEAHGTRSVYPAHTSNSRPISCLLLLFQSQAT
jgi:hypothetical protein